MIIRDWNPSPREFRARQNVGLPASFAPNCRLPFVVRGRCREEASGQTFALSQNTIFTDVKMDWCVQPPSFIFFLLEAKSHPVTSRNWPLKAHLFVLFMVMTHLFNYCTGVVIASTRITTSIVFLADVRQWKRQRKLEEQIRLGRKRSTCSRRWIFDVSIIQLVESWKKTTKCAKTIPHLSHDSKPQNKDA